MKTPFPDFFSSAPPAAPNSVIRRAIDRRGLITFLAASLACAILAVAALAHAWLRTRVTERGYALSRLSAEYRDLTRDHQLLQIRSAELKSPQRIEDLARSRLGMGPPPAERVIVLVGGAARESGPSMMAQVR